MSFSLRYVAFGIASLVQLAHGTASTISYETCTTGFGKISVYPVPSTTYALTLTFHPTAYSTLTPIITATPSPLTVGTTLFTTTTIIEPVVTDTFSSTSTKIDTATVQVTPTSTVTNTITTTTTLPTPTSTIPTSPGFVPVASATAQFNARRRRDVLPRDQSSKKNKPENKCSVNKDGHVSCSPARYPTAVKCGELIEVFSDSTIVSTGLSTVTQMAPTPTITSTTVNTITATSYPVDASVNLTFSTTITGTATVTDAAVTSTVSTTMTVTVNPPQATFHAACGTNNMVNQVNGYGIETFNFVGSLNVVGDGNTSPYDCCVACITDPNCGASLDVSGLCQVFYPKAACGGPNTFAGYYLGGQTAGFTPAQGFTVSDGNCGQASAGGTD